MAIKAFNNLKIGSNREKLAWLIWYLRKGAIPLVRGCFFNLTHAKKWTFRLIGSKVKVLYSRYLHLGKFVYIGDFCQINALTQKGIWLDDRVTIREFGLIQGSSNPINPGVSLHVGRDVYIGPRCNIGIGGPVTIKSGCQIGADFTLVAENHIVIGGVASETEVSRKGIQIGEKCWIGHRVLILDGVVLGDGVIVGAGSVVTKSFENGVVAGNPARRLGNGFEN